MKKVVWPSPTVEASDSQRPQTLETSVNINDAAAPNLLSFSGSAEGRPQSNNSALFPLRFVLIKFQKFAVRFLNSWLSTEASGQRSQQAQVLVGNTMEKPTHALMRTVIHLVSF